MLGEREPTVDDLKRLPYTLQVVKEVLRLWPAAPFYVRDAVQPVDLLGTRLEPGTPVMLAPYWTHRHPDFWDDPERFDPDRFTREAEAARHPQAYHPFATGERVCIGNHFSLLESTPARRDPRTPFLAAAGPRPSARLGDGGHAEPRRRHADAHRATTVTQRRPFIRAR